MAALFTSVVRVDIDEYDNRVFVGSDSGLQARALRQAVQECPELAETLPILSFRTL